MMAEAGDRSTPGRETFATLLQRYRFAAGLSQDELAERAGLSARGISDLERGARVLPHPATARRLAAALELDASDRARLLRSRASDSAPEPSGEDSPPEPSGEPAQLHRADLPRELTSFVGREHDLDELARRLDAAALVTIAGPGGAGKTRLALHLAHHVLASSPPADGVMLVELAPLTDSRHVAQALAEGLGLPEPSGQALTDVLARALRPKRLLLILDNCEHLVDACAALADRLVRSCPQVRVLATSREALGAAGEVVYRIPPLRLPMDDTPEALAASESGRLFVQRAQAANAQFALTPANARAVAEICRRLDGLPLAIELAAARVAALAPADIAARLDDAIRLVGDGPRGAPIRQRTLEAAVAWSFALLDEPERCLFARLAVFAGGFTLAACQAVAAGDLDGLAVLPRLVAKSMVQAEPQVDGGVRYRVLEPLRQFARARLVESGELELARRRQAEYVLDTAERVMREAAANGQFEATPQLNLETDNVRIALEWALEQDDVDFAARAGAALWMWWSRPDRQAQGRVWLERVMSRLNAEVDNRLRGRLVVGLAFLCLMQGDMPAAARLAGEVRQLTASVDDDATRAIASSVLAAAMVYTGQLAAAEPVLRESHHSAAAAGLGWVEMLDLGTLGQIALSRGDRSLAEVYVRASLRVSRAGLDPWSRGIALNNFGDFLRTGGDTTQAGQAYAQALSLFASIDPHRPYIPHGLLHNLGYVALAGGDVRRAASLFVESADVYRAVGTDRRGLAECIIGLGCTAARARQPELAARLFGSGEVELERLGSVLTTANRAEHEQGLAVVEASLGVRQLGALRLQGRQIALDDALELARGLEPNRRETQPVPAGRRADGLTGREYEVAVLMARGLTNRQVAQQLVITEKTVKNHVQRVLDKLGVRSRAEVAARADEFGLRDRPASDRD